MKPSRTLIAMFVLPPLLSAGAPSARADWPAGGLRLATGVVAGNMAVYPDGNGGAIVFAPEALSSTDPKHVFARVTYDGSFPVGWPSSAIEPSPSFRGFALDPGGVGLYVDQPSDYAFRVRRMQANGTLDARWPEGGVSIASPLIGSWHVGGGMLEPDGYTAASIGDGAGGLYHAWFPYMSQPVLYVTRVLDDGSLAPGWGTGVVIPLPAGPAYWASTLPSKWAGQQLCTPLTLSASSLVVAGDVWCRGLLPDGTVTNVGTPFQIMLSPDGGMLGSVTPTSDAVASSGATSKVQPQDVPDGQGGVFHFWLEFASGVKHLDGDLRPIDSYVYLLGQHQMADGTLAPGWPATGAKRILLWPPGIIQFTALSNLRGGVLLAFQKWQNTTPSNPDVFALGIDGAGQPTTGVPRTPGSRAMRLVAGPVPSRAGVALSLSTPNGGLGEVAVFDVHGRRVRVLYAGDVEPGERTLSWDGADESGRPSPPGVYLARATFGGTTIDTRIVRIR
jgi:hypothetical protein